MLAVNLFLLLLNTHIIIILIYNSEGIIAEWVDVTDTKGDYRLHLWLPLKDDLYIEAKEGSVIANKNTRKVKSKRKCYSLV